jgi:carbamate kinase
LVLATDVEGVFLDWGRPGARLLRRVTPGELRAHGFASGSMGPKVEAACSFVEATGKRASIGALGDLERIVAGEAGTIVERGAGAPEGPGGGGAGAAGGPDGAAEPGGEGGERGERRR